MGVPTVAPSVVMSEWSLARPEAYPDDTSAREIAWLQTHLSHVFLSSARVYKFRKPVDLGFELLDGARSHLGMDAVDELLLHFRV